MKPKNLIVTLTFAEDGEDAQTLIRRSFASFLRRELEKPSEAGHAECR